MRALEHLRRETGASLNQVAITSLGRGLGIADRKPIDNGLSALAGTWTQRDLLAFERATRAFQKIDDPS